MSSIIGQRGRAGRGGVGGGSAVLKKRTTGQAHGDVSSEDFLLFSYTYYWVFFLHFLKLLKRWCAGPPSPLRQTLASAPDVVMKLIFFRAAPALSYRS